MPLAPEVDPVAQVFARLPDARVVVVDGRSGSGKTELARRLAEHWQAEVIHLDDLYQGWHGLAAGQRYLIETIIAPLAAGRTARWQHWNWAESRRDRWQSSEPEQKLIIEGAGSLTKQTRRLADLAVWLEAPEQVRRERARSRDGGDWWWELWAAQEAEHLRTHKPYQLADLVLHNE